MCQSRHTNLKFDRSCQRQPPTWLCGFPLHLDTFSPYPFLLATTTNTSSPQPPPTSRFDSLVGLTPSQHLCLNTEDHNHHQRVFLTRWWALLSLNLERRPPPPPTSHFDSLVGLTPSQHLCLNTEDHNHHQRVFLTRWWVYFVVAATYQPPFNVSPIHIAATPTSSLMDLTLSTPPPSPPTSHQRVFTTRWWLFFAIAASYQQKPRITSHF